MSSCALPSISRLRIFSALAIILLSPSMFERYGLTRTDAIMPIDSPAIISIPLAFATLVVVSLLTQKDNEGLASENDNGE